MGKRFFEQIKGPMDNYEDWYEYDVENDQIIVTHSWSHVSPRLSSSSGSKKYTLDEFKFSNDVDRSAKVALDKALAE